MSTAESAPSSLPFLKVKVIFLAGPEKGRIVDFKQQTIRIGRNADNDLVIATDVKISRYHAELIVGQDNVYIRNVSGQNYVLINDKEVQESLVLNKQYIKIGETELQIGFDSKSPLKPLMAVAPAPPTSPIGNPPVRREHSPAFNGGVPSVNRPASVSSGVNSKKNQNLPPADHVFKGFARRKEQKKSPAGFLIVLVVAIGVVYYLFVAKPEAKKKANALKLRDNITTQQVIDESKKNLEDFKVTKEKLGQDSQSYAEAHKLFLKGFRDYRNGSYERAKELFAAALAFHSEHEQAKRYYYLAKRKSDEFALYHFNLAKRYYGLQNFRLCKAHFNIVVRAKKDEKDEIRLEAMQRMKECEAKLEGNY